MLLYAVSAVVGLLLILLVILWLNQVKSNERLTTELEIAKDKQLYFANKFNKMAANEQALHTNQEKLQDKVQTLFEQLKKLEEEHQALYKKVQMLPGPGSTKEENSGPKSFHNLGSPIVKEVAEKLAKGVAPLEIAAQTGLQVGEIELIRGLKQYLKKG